MKVGRVKNTFNALPKPARRVATVLIVLGVFELLALFVGVGAGRGYEDDLSLFTGVNVTVLGGVAVVYAVNKLVRMLRHGQPSSSDPKWLGWMLGIFGLAVFVGIFIGWRAVAFPGIVNHALQQNGVDTTATVTHITYLHWEGSGRGGSYEPVNSLDQADSMTVTLHYAEHNTDLYVNESDDNFWLLSSNLQGGRVFDVRYLRQLPGIVRIIDVQNPTAAYQ